MSSHQAKGNTSKSLSWRETLHKQIQQHRNVMNVDNSDDESIEIIIEEPKAKQDSKSCSKSKNAGQTINSSVKSILSDKSLSDLDSFKYVMDQRRQKRDKNVDSRLAPSIHTRAKGEVKNFNEFMPYDVDQKEFKEGRYEYKNKSNLPKPSISTNKSSRPIERQSTLKVIHLEEPKKSKQLYGDMRYYTKHKPEPTHRPAELQIVKSISFQQGEKRNEERKKEKMRRKQQQKERQERQKQERVERMSNKFSSLLGLGQKQQKKPEDQQSNPLMLSDSQESENGGLKNLDILHQIQEEENYMGDEFDFDPNEEKQARRKNKLTGLGDMAKVYQKASEFPFVKAILSHNFSSDLKLAEIKKIPNIFEDGETYKKTFHYLVINECISDLHQRIKGLEKNKTQKIKVKIEGGYRNSEGLSEFKVVEESQSEKNQQTDKKFLLKNFSMSKNRLGILTNIDNFNLGNIGINFKWNLSHTKKQIEFGFLCMLKTPESKADLKDPVVIVHSVVKEAQIPYPSTAYFYDLEKLSTNIREYLSISHIQYSQLSQHIYNPKCIETEFTQFVDKKHRSCIDPLLENLNESFNQTQFESIREMVLRENGIVLLQGPPGTGKTSTLIGLLAAQYQYLKKTGDRRKIMICAPSNAAINHIIKRIKTEGLATEKEAVKVRPRIIRAGIVESEDPDILSCSLDHLCEQKLIEKKDKQAKDSNMTSVQIREKLILLQKEIKSLNFTLTKLKRESATVTKEIQKRQEELDSKNEEYLRMENLLYSFRRQRIISRKFYQQMQSKLLSQAEIIVATLSSSGNEKLEQIRGDIACLIVDEAAQATEPSLLIALQSGVNKVLLIGDPCQLPATTMSSDSNVTLFNRSLLQRFIDSGIKPYFLNIQYRMAPMIRSFPSQKFYEGRLLDGSNIQGRIVPEVLEGFSGRSVIFVDIAFGKEVNSDKSFCNYDEARFVEKLLEERKLLEEDITVGVITPYQAQRKLLINRLTKQNLWKQNNQKKAQKATVGHQKQSKGKIKQASSQEEGLVSQSGDDTSQIQEAKTEKHQIMINTIDSFQGQEKDLIIISTVRSNSNKQIGFLTDERRINVSITRAKYALVIVGCGDTLASNEIWSQYLKQIQSNRLYFRVRNLEEEHQLLNQIWNSNFYNRQSITRKHYEVNEMTFDVRKQERKEIEKSDFLKNQQKKQNKRNLSQIERTPSRKSEPEKKLDSSHDSLPCLNAVNNVINLESDQLKVNSRKFNSHSMLNGQDKNGHLSHEINKEAQKLIEEKRRKEEQTKKFESTCQRVEKLEKQVAKDDFYKFLFQ